jgi:hypothetical protein
MQVTVDTKTMDAMINKLASRAPRALSKSLEIMSDELLRLSDADVPHDEGTLEGSGRVDKISDEEYQVGYHTKYAARLHENPQYAFQKGRKGKYLEDPVKKNMKKWEKFLINRMNGIEI